MQTEGSENQTCKQHQFSFLFKAHKETLPDRFSLRWENRLSGSERLILCMKV